MSLALAACGGGGGGGGETGSPVSSANPSDVMGAGATSAGSSTGATTAPTTTSTTGTGSTTTAGVQPGTATATPSGGMTEGTPLNSEEVTVASDADGSRKDSPAAARLKNGGYAIAWVSIGQGICTRTYTATATPAGDKTCLATSPTAAISKPAVAGLAGGGYVVVFAASEFGTGVNMQRFDDAGKIMGLGQLVNTASSNRDTQPTVAALEGGDYVVGWTSAPNAQPANTSDIVARRYRPDGVAVSVARRVNTFIGTTGSRRFNSAVAALRDGGYVFAWTSDRQNANGASLYKQRFDADGVPVGSETLVNASTVGVLDYFSSVAGLAGGGYVIAWTFDDNIIAQRFNADGTRAGAAAAVDPQAPDPTVLCDRGSKVGPGPCSVFQRGAAPAGLDDGGYVIAYLYTGRPLANEQGIYARRFAADGTPAAPSQRINRTQFAFEPTASPTGNGGFVVAWRKNAASPGDASGIYARTFDSGGF